MSKPDFEIKFKYRSSLYILFGATCAALDILIFNILIKIIQPLFANPIGYFIGSICSYLLNKKFTFKSRNTILSLKRYSIILFCGLLISQLIIYIGISFLKENQYILLVKFIAMTASAVFQFTLNNKFSNK